ncbi:MAG: hypothetical protein M0R33_10075 [Methylomonas sp.]|jgi:hypothetical protein|uniref:hypothetical protein n=1 Tax=Methylomonas sp. TaxID=418 RepID=UPI0025FBE7DF|nr:hypothetical protein [Methylomonas sp.]MCK9606777.1 hypothetical protein [Methylomonas sp.]
MNIKNLILIAALTLSAGTCFANSASARSSQKSITAMPASPLQLQVLAAKPKITAEFARFEAVPVRSPKALTYQGRTISPNQLEVLGKKIK